MLIFMVRVLNITGLALGGAEATIMNYYRNIDRSKVQFDFLFTTTAENWTEKHYYEDEAEGLGAKIYRRPLRTRNPVKSIVALRKALKSDPNIKIAHIHASHAHGAALDAMFAKLFGVKARIVYSSNDLSSNMPLVHRLLRPIVRFFATHYACASEAAGISMFGEKACGKFIYIPRARDLDAFRFNVTQRTEIRKAMGLDGRQVVLNVGRLVEQKNQLFLLDAFNAALKQNHNMILLIAGEGHLRVTLEASVDKLGLHNSVRILGKRDDIHSLMQAADLFVLPSLHEGLPGVAIEAQAAGLPCLLADTISPQAGIIPEAEFLPITQGEEVWVQRMLAKCGGKRYDTIRQMQDAGYDIHTAAKMLEELYLETLKK
jgi:glycosyltransferase involved in cell wall biosynthesis